MPKRLISAALCALAALCLIWPALLNGYPLLFPDTVSYIAEGRPICYALFHAHAPVTIMRSAIYPLLILPFHLNRNPWPILLLHTAIVAYTVYLTTRSIVARHALNRTALILAVLGLTSLSWYIVLLMPDVLGGPLYLALYLFTFARETLSRHEQILLAAIAILCATSHSTHLALTALLCVVVWLYAAISKSRPTVFALHYLVLLLAGIAQVAVYTRLANKLVLAPPHPPYLEARILADGPGATYLRTHCPQPALPALCAHLGNLPPDDDQFLWASDGIWSNASPGEQTELLHEEWPLLRATVLTYPGQQLSLSLHNFFAQLVGFGLDNFDNNDYMQHHLDDALPRASAVYAGTLQSRSAVPCRIPTLIGNLLVVLALISIGFTWRAASPRLRSLTLTILLVVLANAALTGIASEVDSRYQARIIWLLPLTALLALFERRDRAQSVPA